MNRFMIVVNPDKDTDSTVTNRIQSSHVMVEGKIIQTGDASLVEEINRNGFAKYEKTEQNQ